MCRLGQNNPQDAQKGPSPSFVDRETSFVSRFRTGRGMFARYASRFTLHGSACDARTPLADFFRILPGEAVSDKLHLVCPHCRSVNRMPAARLTEHPQCGQCHLALFTGHPITLTAADFDRQASQADIPLVVDFWAPWCGPCQMMAPAYEQAAKALEPHVRLAKVNTEEERELATRFGIASIPTMILFRGGRELARRPGALGQQDIVRWIRSHI